MRHIEPQAGFENAQAPGYPHAPVGVRHRDHSAPALEQRANAARHEYQHNRRPIEDRKVKKSDFIERCAGGVNLMCSARHCGCAANSVTSWAPRWVPVIASGGSSTAIASKNGAAHLKNGFRRSQK